MSELNAEKARKMLNAPEVEYERLHGPVGQRSYAAGYLAALEGPEVKALVEIVKAKSSGCRCTPSRHCLSCRSKEALSAFRKAVGK